MYDGTDGPDGVSVAAGDTVRMDADIIYFFDYQDEIIDSFHSVTNATLLGRRRFHGFRIAMCRWRGLRSVSEPPALPPQTLQTMALAETSTASTGALSRELRVCALAQAVT